MRFRRRQPAEQPTVAWSDAPEPAPEPTSYAVADLLDEPAVAAAMARAPQVWRSCVDMDYADGSDPFGFEDSGRELMAHVWIGSTTDTWGDPAWEIGLGDELFAYVDLRDESEPVVAFLRSHPDVAGDTVEHDDTERFILTPVRAFEPVEVAVIAIDALAAGHLATRRASGRD